MAHRTSPAARCSTSTVTGPTGRRFEVRGRIECPACRQGWTYVRPLFAASALDDEAIRHEPAGSATHPHQVLVPGGCIECTDLDLCGWDTCREPATTSAVIVGYGHRVRLCADCDDAHGNGAQQRALARVRPLLGL